MPLLEGGARVSFSSGENSTVTYDHFPCHLMYAAGRSWNITLAGDVDRIEYYTPTKHKLFKRMDALAKSKIQDDLPVQ